MLVIALLVLILVVAWLGAAWLLDRHGRDSPPSGTFDAIVVLGCRVWPDGSPSGHLARRVERAVELWRRGLAPIVVMTGGGEPSEAEVAARYAADLGLAASATVLERRSRTTEENARFGAELIEGRSVLVVTDSYHVLRARRVFRRHFPAALAVGVNSPRGARLENSMREVLAVGWDLVRRSAG